MTAKASRRMADLARKGAFGKAPVVRAGKAKAAPRKRRPKSILPEGIEDLQLGSGSGQFGWRPAPKETDSRIFPGEMASKMSNLMRGGIDGLMSSHNRLTVANPHSPFALPSMGDTSIVQGAGVHQGLSFQGAQTKWQPMTKGDSRVQAGLRVEALNVTTLQPFFHTPGNAQDAYNLPKSYVEQIRWSRLMYNLNPYIHAITDLKAFYPLSKFRLTTSEPWVTQFYESNSFNKSFNLYKFACRMNLSIKKFGEAIVWGGRKQDGVWPQTGQPRWVWDYFILLEPELVEIKKDIIGSSEPQYFLRPNRDLEDLVRRLRSGDPEVAHLKGKLAEPIMKKIERRELIPLDNSTISAVQYLTDGSATRGTPPYQSLFVNFIFEDFIRLALMAQANRYHFPIELWLLGNLEKGIMPSVADLERLRDLVTQAIQNPPFSIFFPPILDYKALGVQGSLMNIKDDMEYAHKQYLIGLGVNENMILGDSGIFSSNETAGNQSFIRMMQKDRDDIEEWMRWHFYEPLAQWNNLKQNKNGVLVPIVPEIEWEKTLDFKAAEDEREYIKWAWDEGLMDPETAITTVTKRNPEEIAIKMRKAAGGPFDKEGRFAHAAKTTQDTGGGEEGGPEGPGEKGAAIEAPGGTEETAATEEEKAGGPPEGGAKAPEGGGGEGGGAGAPAEGGAG